MTYEATAFLVNPATLELIIDKLNGMPATYPMKMKSPSRLLPIFGPYRTRTLPIKLTMHNVPATMQRQFWNLVQRNVAPKAKMPWTAPIGICNRYTCNLL